jgi:SAM-dependent methyltransferase
MTPAASAPPRYEDLVGAAESHGEDWFEGGEFEARARMERTHYWHVHRRRLILALLRRHAPAAAGPLLDLGCGVGTVATHLNQHGYEVDYADVYARALELAAEGARQTLGPRAEARCFLRVDATRAVPRRGHAGVLLLDVIEHLPDDVGALRNVRAALEGTPDAFVLVTVPAFQFLWSPWDDLERHKRRYDRAGLGRVLESAGFRVEASSHFFAPLFPAALGMKAVRRVRDAIRRAPAPREIQDLTEGRSVAWLDVTLGAVLALERPWLARRALPFGTSLYAFARAY